MTSHPACVRAGRGAKAVNSVTSPPRAARHKASIAQACDYPGVDRPPPAPAIRAAERSIPPPAMPHTRPDALAPRRPGVRARVDAGSRTGGGQAAACGVRADRGRERRACRACRAAPGRGRPLPQRRRRHGALSGPHRHGRHARRRLGAVPRRHVQLQRASARHLLTSRGRGALAVTAARRSCRPATGFEPGRRADGARA